MAKLPQYRPKPEIDPREDKGLALEMAYAEKPFRDAALDPEQLRAHAEEIVQSDIRDHVESVTPEDYEQMVADATDDARRYLLDGAAEAAEAIPNARVDRWRKEAGQRAQKLTSNNLRAPEISGGLPTLGKGHR